MRAYLLVNGAEENPKKSYFGISAGALAIISAKTDRNGKSGCPGGTISSSFPRNLSDNRSKSSRKIDAVARLFV